MPPELSDDRVRARGQVRDLKRALHRARALRAPNAIQAREHHQHLAGRQLDVEVVQLRHHAHLHPRLLGLSGKREAEHSDLALVGERLRGQHAHGRRLSRAVGAEQAEADAGRRLEIQAIDGLDRAEALRHAAQRDSCLRAGMLGAHRLTL